MSSCAREKGMIMRPKQRSETARDAMNQFCTVLSDLSVEIAIQTRRLPTTIRIMMHVMKNAKHTIPKRVYPDSSYGIEFKLDHHSDVLSLELLVLSGDEFIT